MTELIKRKIENTEAYPHFRSILQHLLRFPSIFSNSCGSFRSGVAYVKFCYFKLSDLKFSRLFKEEIGKA